MKRYVSCIMCVVLVTVSCYRPLPVRAIGAAGAVTVWEIVQLILLSVGVTVTGYELLDDTSIGEKVMDELLEDMNKFKTGLGTAIKSYATGASVAGLLTVTVAKSTWDDLKAWAKARFTSSTEYHPGTVQTDKVVDGLDDFIRLIQQTCGAALTDDGLTKLETFLGLAYEENAPISVCFFKGDVMDSSTWRMYLTYRYDGLLSIPEIYLYSSMGRPSQVYIRDVERATFRYLLLSDLVHDDETILKWDSVTLSSYISNTFVSSLTDGYTYWNPVVGSFVAVDVQVDIDPGFRAEVEEDDLVIVTPGMTYEDGVLEGDLQITLPTADKIKDILDGVKDGTKDITDALEDVGVFPATKTDEKSITDAMDKAAAAAGTAPSINHYTLPLDSFFPFCIPFDVVDMLECLAADPVAPSYTFSMPVGYDGKNVIYQDYTISLEMFDPVAEVLRTMETLLFMVGLAMATRSLFIRS